MGFFKRADPPRMPASGLAAPVSVELGDKDRVRRLLLQFEDAVGDDAAVRYFARELNEAGGWKSAVDTTRAVGTWGSDVVHRPWRWVAAVARAVLQEGDAMTAARIAVMAEFWRSEIVPRQVVADQLDGEIGAPPQDVFVELCHIGLAALSTLPPSEAVVHSRRRGETVTVDTARIMCCLRLIRFGRTVVGAETIEQAYGTLEAMGVDRARADEGAMSLKA